MQTYQPPLDRLLPLGEVRGQRWRDYRALGIGQEHIPELLRMMTDMELNLAPTDSKEVWAPLHAWRALGELQATEAIEPYLELMARLNEEALDDWVREDADDFFIAIGPPSLPALERFLADEGQDPYLRWRIVEAMQALAMEYPELRQQVVNTLLATLQRTGDNPEELNAGIIAAFIELEATEAAPAIEAAYQTGRVDEVVVGTKEQVLFDLGVGPPPPLQDEDMDFVPDTGFFPPRLFPGEPPPRKHKEKAKAKRKIAKASRKRNRKKH